MSRSKASIPVTLSKISLRPEDLPILPCPSCLERLELHQPDSGFPERMLWTCDHCRTWFLMDLIPNSFEATLVWLPDGDYFLKAIAQ